MKIELKIILILNLNYFLIIFIKNSKSKTLNFIKKDFENNQLLTKVYYLRSFIFLKEKPFDLKIVKKKNKNLNLNIVIKYTYIIFSLNKISIIN